MEKEKRTVTLDQIRKASGRSQKDIASALRALGREASQAYISKLESGGQSVTIELGMDLAKAYAIPFYPDLVRGLGFNTDESGDGQN
jgi:transcriptional regulator with XRE-family HTH domain